MNKNELSLHASIFVQLFLCNHFWWCNNFCATNIPKRNILKLRSIISELWAIVPPSGNALWKAILTLLGTHLPFPKIRLFFIDYTAKAALKNFITHILAETIIFSKIKSTLFIKSIFITRTTNWNFSTVSRIIIQTCISTNILIQIVFTLDGQNNLIIFVDESFKFLPFSCTDSKNIFENWIRQLVPWLIPLYVHHCTNYARHHRAPFRAHDQSHELLRKQNWIHLLCTTYENQLDYTCLGLAQILRKSYLWNIQPSKIGSNGRNWEK